MAKLKKYICTPLRVSDKEAFFEASTEELRILALLIEKEGCSTAEELSALARVSVARARAALVFWEDAGVIRAASDFPTITEEFEERINAGEIREVSADDTARTIRKESLADMISECAKIMGRAAFNSAEIKQLVALYDQYALSEEFIVTLAAYLTEGGKKLTVTKLINKAVDLAGREVDTPAALEEYIAQRESDSEAEREFRKIFGIYNRALSKTEKECFERWSREYGYFTEIVGEAYDIAVTTRTSRHLSYANELLSGWYQAGCRTVAECRAKYERDLAEKKSKKDAEKPKKAEKEKTRYGHFDPEEAFLRAVERSYGKKKEGD